MPRRRRDEPAKLPKSISNIVDIEDIYPIINYVQVTREPVSFVARHEDSITMETLIRDSEIRFDRRELRKGIRYNLQAPPVKVVPDERVIFDEDEYPDELIEEGQCF